MLFDAEIKLLFLGHPISQIHLKIDFWSIESDMAKKKCQFSADKFFYRVHHLQ